MKLTIRQLRILAAAGLVIYAFWSLSYTFNPGLSYTQSYVSELDVSGQPNVWLFRLANFFGATLLFTAFFFYLRICKRNGNKYRQLKFIKLLSLATAAAIVNSFFPMDCSASQSSICYQHQQAYTFSFSQWIHLLTSIVMFGGLIFAQYYSTFFIIKSNVKRFWFRISLSNLIIQIILNIVLAIISFTSNGPIGLLQRASLLLFEAWIIFILFDKKLGLLPA